MLEAPAGTAPSAAWPTGAAVHHDQVEGKPIDLKASLGKNVILLDFWATWCGPCVKAMPEVEAVAKKFKEKGLVFYAVNAGEDAATIKEFLSFRQARTARGDGCQQ